MKSIRTTLGGALSALGKGLMGVGVVPQLSGVHNEMLTFVAITGFCLDAIGGFFGHLFAADHASVINAIERSGGDTTWTEKPPSD